MEPAEPPKSGRKVLGCAVAAIGILGFMLWVLPHLGPIRGSSHRVATKNNAMQLRTALNAHRLEYGHFPSGSHAEIVSILGGSNPRHVIFMEFPPKALSAKGEFLDPWGNPFRIDTSDPATAKVYSFGRNKRDDHGAEGSDDIVSWR